MSPIQSFDLGNEVEVFSSYRNSWARGFEIAAIHDDRYALRRRSDWAVIPGTFAANALRRPANTGRGERWLAPTPG